MSIQLTENENVTRQLNVFKHIKKKAANDAQLLMWVNKMFCFEQMVEHTSLLTSYNNNHAYYYY